jgi:hypothetical protein
MKSSSCKLTLGWAVSAILVIVSCQTEMVPGIDESQLPAVVDYNYHVKPILSDRCFTCHGPDPAKREGDLRLDLPESAFAELVNAPGVHAIVPGNPRSSEVYHRILSNDAESRMPPPESKLQLSDREKAILIKWISQGAIYKPHWSFSPPRQVKVPGGLHPIDYFLNEKLSDQHLKPQPPASRETLLRRARFDLTGLPPLLEEVDAFVGDSTDNAYEKIIDRLLEDPAYGERMAADWMDVARYADSDGYLDDKHREFSPWRDWVIQAFNDNVPYDLFVTWQLAGDLLPDARQESILATAFNRLHRRNSEAGIVFEEYRTEYVADRVHTFSKAFLGLTMECARCHDHKYDPITQQEYYQLFAYFNNTNELGTAVYGPDQTPGPSLLLTSEEQREMIDFLSKKIKDQEQLLDKITVDHQSENLPDCNPEDVRRSYTGKLVSHTTFDREVTRDNRQVLPDQVAGGKFARMVQPVLGAGRLGKGFYVEDYNYVLLGEKIGWYDRTDPFSVSLWIRPAETYEQAGIFTHCEDLRLGYKGYSLHLQDNRLRFIIAYSWPTNAIEVLSEAVLPEDEWSYVAITYDGSSQAGGVRMYINGHPVATQTLSNHLYKSILFEPDIHTYGFAGFRLGYRDKIKPFKGGAFDEVKIFNDRLSGLEVLLDYDPDDFSIPDQNPDLIREHLILNDDPDHRQWLDSLTQNRVALNQLTNQISEIMVMGDLPEPRATFLLERGQYDAPRQQVYPALPAALWDGKQSFSQDRLGLAQWLFSPENPLTARVIVNRIWQQHFGVGLVTTAEDFGAQGSLPTHPELLDWLAVWFRESGWDIKKLHRLILTSAAYQRSSAVDSIALVIDPENRWLWRGPSIRLTAEMLRDNALAISGLLVEKPGGPSVYPYQPEGLWDELSNKSWRYPYLQEPGEGLYRRSLYTIWKRTSPPPAMLLFDVPDRSFCTVQRRQTSTPLQALAILNDPQYVEAARVLAWHCQENHTLVKERLRQIFRLTIGRKPTEGEQQKLHSYYQQELERIRQGKLDLPAYLKNGETRLPEEAQLEEIGALAMTAHSLLNTYEAQMKK